MVSYKSYEVPEKGWAVMRRKNARRAVRVKQVAIALLGVCAVLTAAKAAAGSVAGEERHAPKRLVVLEVEVAEEETVVLTTWIGGTAVVSDHVRGFSFGLVPEVRSEDGQLQVRVFAVIGEPKAATRGEELEVLDVVGATTIEGVFLRVQAELVEETAVPNIGCAVSCGSFFTGGLVVKARCGSCSSEGRRSAR